MDPYTDTRDTTDTRQQCIRVHKFDDRGRILPFYATAILQLPSSYSQPPDMRRSTYSAMYE